MKSVKARVYVRVYTRVSDCVYTRIYTRVNARVYNSVSVRVRIPTERQINQVNNEIRQN